MNEFACVVYVGVFIAMPPLLLLARAWDKQRMPWIVLFVTSAIVGWLLVNLAYWFYVNGLLVEMSQAGDSRNAAYLSPRDQFLFRFGGLFGPLYLLPWLFLYGVIVLVRRLWRGRG